MSKENNKGLIVLVAVLSLLVLVLSSYLIYDKVIAKDNDGEIVNEDTNKEENNNNVVENDKKEEIDVIETVKVPTELEKYKNTDGSYGYMKTFRTNVASGDFTIKLSLDGKIYVNKYGEKDQILKIDNVVDLEPLGADGYLFILTINGDIYRYDLFNYDQKNYEPKKLEEYSKVDKFLSLSYCPEKNAGCCNSLFGVTKDNKYIKIIGYCV